MNNNDSSATRTARATERHFAVAPRGSVLHPSGGPQRTSARPSGNLAVPAPSAGTEAPQQKGGRDVIVLREEIGEVLRDARQRQGRTLREVSSEARVSLGYLSEIERGQKEASSELLFSVSQALEVPMSHVLRAVSDRIAVQESLFTVPDTVPDIVPDDLASTFDAAALADVH